MYYQPLYNQDQFPIISILSSMPQAVSVIHGSNQYPDISGTSRFYQTNEGVLVYTEATGLPTGGTSCQNHIFAFHIHEGTACSGDRNDPFADAMTHYNPDNCSHPTHAGDLPPLFENHGFALSIFLTDRFSVRDIIGRTVIIHDKPDDFTTQPSGNSGTKIACGIIRRIS